VTFTENAKSSDTCTDGELQAKLQQGNQQENTKIGFPSKNTVQMQLQHVHVRPYC